MNIIIDSDQLLLKGFAILKISDYLNNIYQMET